MNHPRRIPVGGGFVGDGVYDVPFLILNIKTIFLPFSGVGIDIIPYFPIIRLVTDDMVVVGTLENRASRISIDKSLKCGNCVGQNLICRGRRPRRPVFDTQQQMNMVRHYDVLIYHNFGNVICGLNIFVNNATNFRQNHLRGVEGAAPYNLAKNFPLILGTYRHKIRTVCTVIVLLQPRRLSLG